MPRLGKDALHCALQPQNARWNQARPLLVSPNHREWPPSITTKQLDASYLRASRHLHPHWLVLLQAAVRTENPAIPQPPHSSLGGTSLSPQALAPLAYGSGRALTACQPAPFGLKWFALPLSYTQLVRPVVFPGGLPVAVPLGILEAEHLEALIYPRRACLGASSSDLARSRLCVASTTFIWEPHSSIEFCDALPVDEKASMPSGTVASILAIKPLDPFTPHDPCSWATGIPSSHW